MSADPASPVEPDNPPQPGGAGIREDDYRIASGDQTELFVRRFRPGLDGAPPRARLLWVHGFAEHSGRYLETLRWFAARGFESWALDLRGHGRSGGGRVRIDRFSEYIDDIDAGHNFVAGQHRGETADFYLGHSMGGLALSRWLQVRGGSTHGLAGAVILSPFMGLKMPLPRWTTLTSRVLSRILPHLRLPSRFSTDVLSKDPEVGRAYAADPLIPRGATPRWFTETGAAQTVAVAEAGAIELPLLVMHGLDDSLADVDATRAFFDRLGCEDRELKLWDGLRHELLNEVEGDQVREYILAWLGGRIE